MSKNEAWFYEWQYRYEERKAILTDGGLETPAVRAIAKKEADEAEAKLRQVARSRRTK